MPGLGRTEDLGLPEGLRGLALKAGYVAHHTGWAITLKGVMNLLYAMFDRQSLERPEPEVARAMATRFRALLERDLENVRRGDYPRSLLKLFRPDLLLCAPEAAWDFRRVARRKKHRRHDDLPADVDLSRFPHYYRRNFHWQTDGWLSAHSARIYDLEVELLFGGTADVMRRMAIPPVVEAVRHTAHPRVLDVACGTGRFLAQLGAALPNARYVGLDLSPFYLRRAQSQLRSLHDASFVLDNAEDMPFADERFDVVTSVFLFHELPRAARRNVIREMLRVTRPGGRVVICDSAQLIESRVLEPALRSFARTYHEPFYLDYIADPLEHLLEDAGGRVLSSEIASVSKIVVASKS